MTYKGTIRNGSVILETGAELPDGAEVEVALTTSKEPGADLSEERRQLWQALRALPADASFDDIVQDVYLLYKIERGVRQLDAGQGVPHEEARRKFREWLEALRGLTSLRASRTRCRCARVGPDAPG